MVFLSFCILNVNRSIHSATNVQMFAIGFSVTLHHTTFNFYSAWKIEKPFFSVTKPHCKSDCLFSLQRYDVNNHANLAESNQISTFETQPISEGISVQRDANSVEDEEKEKKNWRKSEVIKRVRAKDASEGEKIDSFFDILSIFVVNSGNRNNHFFALSSCLFSLQRQKFYEQHGAAIIRCWNVHTTV